MDQQAAPYVLAAGQARSHPGAFPTIKAGAADTGGLFTFCDGVLGPRTSGPALHVHYETDECFYVIDGHLLVQVGKERHDLGPGCFAWLPRQVPHTYANVSDSPVRAVSMPCPAGSRSSSPRRAPTSPSCRDHRTRSGSRPSGSATTRPPGRPADRGRRRSRGEPVLTCRTQGQRPGASPGFPPIVPARPPGRNSALRACRKLVSRF